MRGQGGAGATRVAHMSSGHAADDSRILWKECVSLAGAGFEVWLVVPHAGPLPAQWPANVALAAVRRRRGRAGRLLVSPFAVTLAALRCRAAVYHFHDPELIPFGLALRALGRRVVYDVHEDLPRDIAFKPWIPRAARALASHAAEGLEWVAGHLLSGVVAATPVIARRFPSARTALVQNHARLSEFTLPAPRTTPRPGHLAYVGAITAERCALEMLAALERLPDGPKLVLAGDMRPAGLAPVLARQPAWSRVEYRGRQDRDGVRRILAGARLGLALFHPLQSYIDSQPIKIFEYMAAGLPVVASNFPGFVATVEANGCGLCVDGRDPAAIASAIQWILNHPAEAEEMGRRGRALVARQFSWETEAQALLRLYGRIIGAAAD